MTSSSTFTDPELAGARPRRWRRAAVYGLGVSGAAAARFLASRGVRVVAFDRRSAEEIDAIASLAEVGCELQLGAEPAELPTEIDGLVVSPGIPLQRPLIVDAQRRGVSVIGEVELAFPHLRGHIIAVTGSNGKSTTAKLAGAFLESAGQVVEVCGNIGDPVTDRVNGPEGRFFVIEMSSFQLETVDRFRPRCAGFLNLSPDHLDRHGDFDGYAAAKARIFARQTSEDTAILNADDPMVAATQVEARRRFFSRRGPVADGCYLSEGEVIEAVPGDAPNFLFAAKDVPLAGTHNLENAMAAALLVREHGVSAEDMVRAFESFTGLVHRMQRIAEIDGVVWFDDSKGTNPAATLRSIEAFDDGEVHLILGGQFKGGDLSALAEEAMRASRAIYLIGEASETLARALAQVRGEIGPQVESVGTLEQAVRRAHDESRPGETVLLSPACASFDQFDNFAQRGRVFQRLVRALARGAGDGA